MGYRDWQGMYLFRHKTNHWYFAVGMPAILGIQIVMAGCGSSFVWMIPSREKVEKIFAGKEYFGKSAKEKNGK